MIPQINCTMFTSQTVHSVGCARVWWNWIYLHANQPCMQGVLGSMWCNKNVIKFMYSINIIDLKDDASVFVRLENWIWCIGKRDKSIWRWYKYCSVRRTWLNYPKWGKNYIWRCSKYKNTVSLLLVYCAILLTISRQDVQNIRRWTQQQDGGKSWRHRVSAGNALTS